MPIKGDILSAKFSPEISIYDLGTGSDKMKANVAEYIRAEYEVRVFWYAEPSTFDVFLNGNEIRRNDGKSFIDDGFAVGETFSVQYGFGLSGESGAGTISAISEDGFTIFSNVGSLTNGNYDATVECLIAGTSALDQAIYRFGLIENEESFNTFSKLTGDDQKYYVEDLALNSPIFGEISGNIKGWASANEAVSITKRADSNIPINRGPDFSGVGGGVIQNSVLNYTIRHTFPILPYYTVGQLQNIKELVAPDFLAGNNSIKHVFEATFKRNISDEENNKQVRFQSLDGSTGFFNENFNGLQSQYSVTSVNYFDNASGLPNPSLLVEGVTKVTTVINSADGTFTGATRVIAVHSYLPLDEDEYLESQDFFDENFAFQGSIDGGGGSIVTSVIPTVLNPNELQVDILVNVGGVKPELTAESNYLLALIVQDETQPQSNSDRTTLLLDVNVYDKNPDIPDLLFVESEALFSWVDDTAGAGFDDFQGWIEDSILSKFEFKLDRADKNAVLNSFSYKIVAWNTNTDEYFEIQSVPFNISNQIIETGTNDQFIDIDISRGLAVGNNAFNVVKLETSATRTGDFRHYTGEITTKIDWQEWLALPDADTVFLDPNEPNNGLNKNSSRYNMKQDYELRGLLFFEVSQEDNPAITEYIHSHLIVANDYEEFAGEQWSCAGFETRKAENDVSLNGNIIDSEIVIIKAKFEPTGFTPDPLDYVGMIRIEPQLSQGINQLYQIGSNRPVDASYPLIPLDGDNFASITWDGTYLNVECQTNNNFFDISTILPPKLSARLWKTSAPVSVCEIIIQTDIDNTFVVQGEISVGANSGWIYKGVIIVAGDIINQAIATADGTEQTITYFVDDCAPLTKVALANDAFKGPLDLSELTDLQTLQLNNSRIDSLTLAPNNVNPINLFDTEDSEISVLNLTDVNFEGVFMVGKNVESFPLNVLNTINNPVANTNLFTEYSVISSSITSLDISGFTRLSTILRVRGNSNLTSMSFGGSTENFTQISILNSPSLASVIDLSGYTSVNSLQVSNTATTSVLLPIATTVCNNLDVSNNSSLATLDITPLANNIASIIDVNNNNLSTFTFNPISNNTQNITRFDADFNNLSAIDLSKFENLQNDIRLGDNNFPNQAAFTFPTITNVIDLFLIRNNNIAGTWDFTTFMNTNTLSGQFIANNNSISSVVFQTSNLVVSLLRLSNNNIVNFTVSPLTGVNNGIVIDLDFNAMTTASMDAFVTELVATGWTGGTLRLNNQSTAQSVTTGAADYITLDTVLNWTIFP